MHPMNRQSKAHSSASGWQTIRARLYLSYPVGRAVQAAVCKTADAGAIPARDSILPSISVERYTLLAVRKDLPNRNTGRATLMLDHFSRRECRCQPGLHRPGCGGSTPPCASRLFRVASIAAMQRSLKPQSTGQHRGDPPFRRCGSVATAAVS